MRVAPMAPNLKLTYFNIEGAAEKVRLAFIVGGVDFEDDRINFEAWGALKPTTKFGQLPLMSVDGGEPLAQSGAMLRYAGQLAGLYPAEKLLQIEEVIGLEEDMGKAIVPSMYLGRMPEKFGHPADLAPEKKTEIQLALRAKLIEKPDGELLRFLRWFEGMLEDGRQFICGSEVTIADCQFIPRLRHLKKGVLDGIPATIVDDYPKLSAYFDRFHALDKVKAYHERLAAAAEATKAAEAAKAAEAK